MFNADDPETIASLNKLRKAVTHGSRPLVVWLGAGVSKWAELPSWKELARTLVRAFSSESAAFPKDRAKAAISGGDFPLAFQLCKAADAQLYHSLLVSNLTPDRLPELYLRFVRKLRSLTPLAIVTTNVDNLLEQNLGPITTIERSDIERFVGLCQAKRSCIAKIHGSISSVESVVFAEDDYERLRRDKSYLRSLQDIFASCSVVFLGYGLRDQYVIELLKEEQDNRRLFGAGPHFFVSSSDEGPDLPVHPICYSIARHGDHSGAMTALDYLTQSYEISEHKKEGYCESEATRKSAFYITEFYPHGTHNVQQTGTFGRDGLVDGEFTIGLGWRQEELPNTRSHALHDLLTGLLCFDTTYIPIDSLGAAINSLSESVLTELLRSKALQFIHREQEPAVIFPPGEVIGAITALIGRNSENSAPLGVDTLVRRHVQPVPGAEAGFERFVELAISSVALIDGSNEWLIPNMIKSALVMPKVSKTLGFSDAVVPSQIPMWLRFPALRMAHLVQTSQVCQSLGICSVRLPFGGAALISAAFGISSSELFADNYASYVVTGLLQADLGSVVERDRGIFQAILRFRETQSGIELRKYVFDSLDRQDDIEFGAVVDAGLKKSLPAGFLDSARRDLQGLLWANGQIAPTPAVWTSPSFDESSTRIWRECARENLLNLLKQRGSKTSSACPCGSGDKVSNCCLEALRT